MNPIKFELDISKPPAKAKVIEIRQSEIRATTLEVTIIDNGEPVELSPYDVYFECRHIDGKCLQDGDEERLSTEGNVVTYTVHKDVGAREGLIETAYFSLVVAQTDGTRDVYATTNSFYVNVLPNACGKDAGIIEAYSTEIEQMLKYCYDTFKANEQERQETFDANEANRQATFDQNEAQRQADFDANEAARQQTFDTNEADREADFAESIEASDAATARANAAAETVEQAVAGELDPLFRAWIESQKDVEGGLTSYDTFLNVTAILADDVTDEDFLLEVMN